MKPAGVQRLAKVLRVMALVLIVCDIIALFFVPAMVVQSRTGTEEAMRFFYGEHLPHEYDFSLSMILAAWFAVAVWADQGWSVLTVFLWSCGICGGYILWQGRLLLDSILKETPFSMGNVFCFKRAAVCSFIISGAALLRTVWGFFYYQSAAPLLTCSALFVPVFLMAGLMCMVMSALFRQAAGQNSTAQPKHG